MPYSLAEPRVTQFIVTAAANEFLQTALRKDGRSFNFEINGGMAVDHRVADPRDKPELSHAAAEKHCKGCYLPNWHRAYCPAA